MKSQFLFAYLWLIYFKGQIRKVRCKKCRCTTKDRCKKCSRTTKVRCIFCDSIVRFIFDNFQFAIVDSFERKSLYG